MSNPLAHKRILIVEDEAMIGMLIEDAVSDAGAVPVGPAASVRRALELLATEAPLDAALMDMNLAGEKATPVADALKAANVPFVILSGYGPGGVPDGHRGVPVIAKPFTTEALVEALTSLIGSQS